MIFHKKNEIVLLLILTIIATFACVPQEMTELVEEDRYVEEEGTVAEETWIIPDGPVQTLRKRTWDLHHQKLWVRFDFEEQQVLGKTELLLSSKMNQSELILDAKTMEFEKIIDVTTGETLSFEQDSALVTIALGDEYSSGDTLIAGLQFVSSPPDRGLYFVNPTGDNPAKPTQIWTLGQPEDNSFWFPTIDHPAERATQETWISVPPRFTTLSNGLLMESRVKSGDSLRTDYWKMNKPHAPYLFALAVGEYEVVEEVHGDILYRYYTEPGFIETADLIYEQTVEMLRYSEEVTGVSWPWDPVYSQAPVHDYIARGMENTTATILYDAVQFDRRAAPDLSNRDLIMHEIIHHWFGNLVTARNWANLPLNEGFASYFEGLFIRHSEGEDQWLWKNHTDRLSYFREADYFRRPVIFDRYEIPEDMYDRHTYQKAGQILRMLHDYLGDEIWWDGVNMWLEKFSYESVDIYDLQEVYETVSDENLEWFFDQWFLSPGHPYLEISQDITGLTASVTISQIQDTIRQPVFQLYPEIRFEFEDGSVRERVEMTELEETYHFEFQQPVLDIIVDPDRVQLAEYFVDVNLETILQRVHHEHVLVRSEALSLLDEFMEDPDVQQAVMKVAREDPFEELRVQALALLSDYADLLESERVYQLAGRFVYPDEKHFAVRQQALILLKNNYLDTIYFDDQDEYDSIIEDDDSIIEDESGFKESIKNHFVTMSGDTSYFVSAEAIRAFGQMYPDETMSFVEPFLTMESYQDVIREAVTDALIYSDQPDGQQLLLQLAKSPGYRNFSHQALRFLIENATDLEDDVRKSVRSLALEYLESPYSESRNLAYEALVRFGATEAIDLLYRIKERRGIGETERREIRDTIRALEYDRNHVD